MSARFEAESLVDIWDQPFVAVDHEFRVVVVNRAFEKMYGIPRGAAVGKHCYSLIQGPHRPCPCDTRGNDCPFSKVFDGHSRETYTRTYTDEEGREHTVRIQSYPLRTTTGEVYIGELIQHDGARLHPMLNQSAAAEAMMVGDSPAFVAAKDRLRKAARSEAPVLLLGETGTGKELAADYIHRHSPRARGPFQTVDCTALTAELFESEVFGHERGSFTGNVAEKPGLFELADGGNLFLDEIGEMPLPLQAKLLRVLETGEYRRVGGTKLRKANVRVIAATNRELRGAPWFRQDLYFRIACVTVKLPSLAERRSDIPLLASALLKRISEKWGKQFTIDKAALKLLEASDLPGNVRELRNILSAAAVNAQETKIMCEHVAAALPPPDDDGHGATSSVLGTATELEQPSGGSAEAPLRVSLPLRKLWKADHLAELLRRHKGNRRIVAETLGVSERTIYRKIKEFGLASWILSLNLVLPSLLESLP